MKILLDHCLPRPFERLLEGQEARHTSRLGWGKLSNGKLLNAAEEADFQVFVTIDQGLRYEQNLASRRLAVIALQSPSNDIPTLTPMAKLVLDALKTIQPGQVLVLRHPDPPARWG